MCTKSSNHSVLLWLSLVLAAAALATATQAAIGTLDHSGPVADVGNSGACCGGGGP
jgi:hypothetical protein